MMKEIPWKTYLFYVLSAEAVGALSGWLTRTGTKIFSTTVEKPPLTPPPAVFPIVWGILFALMGIGGAMVSLAPGTWRRRVALGLYWIQLGFNFLWSILFFNLQSYLLSFCWLAALWGLIVWMTLTFYEIRTTAAWLQVPYLLWVLFAGYLNYGVWRLNP